MLLVRTGSSSQRLDEALPTSPVNPTAIMYETYGIRGCPRGCCRCSRNRTGFCRGSRRGAAPWQLTPSFCCCKVEAPASILVFASFVAAAVEAAGRVCACSCCRRPASVFGERFVRVPPLIQGARPSAPQLANYSHTSVCPSASLPHFRAVSGTGYSVYFIPFNSLSSTNQSA